MSDENKINNEGMNTQLSETQINSNVCVTAILLERCMIVNRGIDCGMNIVRGMVKPSFVDMVEKFSIGVGVGVFYLLGVIGLVAGIVAGSKTSSYEIMIPLGVGILFGSIIFGYFGPKLLQIIVALMQNTKSNFSSMALLDCFVMLFFLLGIISFSSMFFDWGPDWWVGLIGFLIMEFFCVASLRPEIVSTAVDENCSPGEELISILTYFIKLFLRLVPIVWCVGVLALTVVIIIHLGSDDLRKILTTMSMAVVGIGLLPLCAYMIFLFYYFFIDVMRTLLMIPRKLDVLIKK